MSKTSVQQRHFLISKPHLLDIVDEDWMKDTLPDDGGHYTYGSWHDSAILNCVGYL